MFVKFLQILVLGACLWGVLNPQMQTRTVGTLALSMIAILAVVGLCN